MEEILKFFTEWVSALHPSFIVLLISLIAYLENVIPPIPGDLVVVFAGVLASEGIIRVVPVFAGTTIASVIGFMSMYYVGNYLRRNSGELGDQSSWFGKFLHPRHLRKARFWMNKWGQWVIFANRFLAGTRSVIALTAGYSGTKVTFTVINSFLSSLLWNGVLIFAGFVLHENWEAIGKYLSIYSRSILVVLILTGIAVFVYRRNKKRKPGSRRQIDKS